MVLSYAGVALTVPTTEQQESIQAWMDSWSEFEFSGKTWPGKELTGLTFAQANWPCNNPQLGTLYWPFTAMKWAVGHFVCSGAELELIRASLPPSDSQTPPRPAPLIMSTGDAFHSIPTNLFMLPPRPIHQIAGSNQLYLLTLVDERYYWWYKEAGSFQIQNGTTWANLYAELATSLGITITVNPVNGNYFFPDPAITSYYQLVPILLDAVAYNCGQRIIRKLDGTVFAVDNASSLAALNANILAVNNYGSKILGGNFQRAGDFTYAMPAEIHNVTPIWKSNVPSVLTPLFRISAVKLVESSGFNGISGFNGAKTFLDTFHGTEASSFANEALLAEQIALDFWLRIWNGFLDVTLAHPLNVIPDGLHDMEWSYTRERTSTRIKRPTWNWEPDTLLHGDGNGPFYGNSANEPWQVQPFFAQITSSPTGAAYPWKEVIPATGGTFVDKPVNQRTGTDAIDPAYDINLSTSVAANTYVIMWRGFQNAAATKQEWLFTQIAGGGGGGSITVQDSLTTVTGVTIVDTRHSGLVVSNAGGGQADLSASKVTIGGTITNPIGAGAFSLSLGSFVSGTDVFTGATYLISARVYGAGLNLNAGDWVRLSVSESGPLAYSVTNGPANTNSSSAYNISFLWTVSGTISVVFDGNTGFINVGGQVWTATALLIQRV